MRTRLIVVDGYLDHGAEVVIVLLANIDIARVDAVLGELLRALRVLLQQDMTVVMKIAYDRRIYTEVAKRFDDTGDRFSSLIVVNSDPHQLGPGSGQLHGLIYGGGRVRRISVRHRLDNNGVIAAYFDAADVANGCPPTCNRHRFVALLGWGKEPLDSIRGRGEIPSRKGASGGTS